MHTLPPGVALALGKLLDGEVVRRDLVGRPRAVHVVVVNGPALPVPGAARAAVVVVGNGLFVPMARAEPLGDPAGLGHVGADDDDRGRATGHDITSQGSDRRRTALRPEGDWQS